MDYREDAEKTKGFKQSYLSGLEKLILSRQQELSQKRKEYCKNIFSEQAVYREEFKKMLGWPLVDCCIKGIPSMRVEKLSEEIEYTIYRMHFELFDDLEMTGLFFERKGEGKKPLVLVQHGGMGTPELISGIYGSTANYNDMLERVVSRGVHVFAPQLLLWSQEQYGVPRNRCDLDARLKRVGSSITAVEVYGLMRVLDYFETKDNVSDFGMVGMSYGGFYTLYLAAIDTRIKSAISCAFFNTRDQYPWSDWTWFNSAGTFDDAEIACLVYPRKLCLEIGTEDEMFDATYGIKSYERLTEMCKDVGTDWLSFVIFEGTHEFCKDDIPIQMLVDELSNL